MSQLIAPQSWSADDAESLCWAGVFQFDYGDLVQAQTRLERALKLAQAGDPAWCKYCALNTLGDIKRLRGDLRGALESYRDGRAIAERLAKAGPGNLYWWYDLEIRNERIGDVQMAQGDLAGALKSSSDSLAIADRRANSDLGNAGWQRDLSVACQRIGDVQRAKGDLSVARQSYSDSLAIIDRLAKSDSGNAEWQRDLATSFGRLALVQKQSGDNVKALNSYRQGRPILARLTKLSPDNATWKQDLAEFDRQIAELAERQTLAQTPSRNRSPHPMLRRRHRRRLEGRGRLQGNDHPSRRFASQALIPG